VTSGNALASAMRVSAALLIIIALMAPRARATPSARLSAAFAPERLGQPTSIVLAVQIRAPARRAPVPLRSLSIRYPADLGIALSGLGLETCAPTIIEARGAGGCPRDSVMGYGSALGAIPFGPELIEEGAAVALFRAEDQHGRLALLLDAEGISPVMADIVLSAVLDPARTPYGGQIRVAVPPIPSLPEGPDVSILELHATIGPAAGMVYSESAHGKTSFFHPKGILLPDHCPKGGFPFAAALTFSDGSGAAARTNVPCPGAHRPRRRAASRQRRLRH
jgi:hypothetical protein